MRKNLILTGVLFFGCCEAQQCVPQGQVYDDKNKTLTTVCQPPAKKAGIFDGAAPIKEMQTNRELSLPSSVTPITVEAFNPNLLVNGVFNGSQNEFILGGIKIIPGQESAAKRLFSQLFPAGTVGYIEWTGKYKNYKREGELWLAQNLVSVIFVERGLAEPLPDSIYAPELQIAVNFAKENKLGAYIEKK